MTSIGNPEPRIVTPEEAQQDVAARRARQSAGEVLPEYRTALAHTVATAPEREDARTRTAVVKALRDVARDLCDQGQTGFSFINDRAADIENGADL